MVISVNQLSLYGAVADMIAELPIDQRAPGELVALDQMEQEILSQPLLQKCTPMKSDRETYCKITSEELKKLPEDQKLSNLCSEAGLNLVEIGQFFNAFPFSNGVKNQSLCREYTLPQDEKGNCAKEWIENDARFGLVSDTKGSPTFTSAMKCTPCRAINGTTMFQRIFGPSSGLSLARVEEREWADPAWPLRPRRGRCARIVRARPRLQSQEKLSRVGRKRRDEARETPKAWLMWSAMVDTRNALGDEGGERDPQRRAEAQPAAGDACGGLPPRVVWQVSVERGAERRPATPSKAHSCLCAAFHSNPEDLVAHVLAHSSAKSDLRIRKVMLQKWRHKKTEAQCSC